MGSLLGISVSQAYKPEDLEEFYRQYNSGEEIVCQRFNLRDADLSGLKLLKANFSGADLTKTDFRGTDLSGADVTGATLNGAKLKKAVLKDLIAFDTSAKGTCLEDQSFLKANNIKFSVSAFKTQKLDLHGCVLKSVPGLIDAFLESSYGRWSKIEIVTGRGIHNLSEKKGKLSRYPLHIAG
ncbi:MAG: hypothetical protein B7Y25_08115 [Alphaproteobacteria bacterium 16-39-46]|nr:MAG: hypothetical protein B7Y25_08115 [Alphaproteobacteria bacterium 16-39-46]OZA41282.1 MAG: hypothetical protein B7X84_08265 [Alphaproteobacteria bacterium 17-39-52]